MMTVAVRIITIIVMTDTPISGYMAPLARDMSRLPIMADIPISRYYDTSNIRDMSRHFDDPHISWHTHPLKIQASPLRNCLKSLSVKQLLEFHRIYVHER